MHAKWLFIGSQFTRRMWFRATLYGVFRAGGAAGAAAGTVEAMGYRCYVCRATPGIPDPNA